MIVTFLHRYLYSANLLYSGTHMSRPLRLGTQRGECPAPQIGAGLTLPQFPAGGLVAYLSVRKLCVDPP